jgi:hypothetical protein
MRRIVDPRRDPGVCRGILYQAAEKPGFAQVAQ